MRPDAAQKRVISQRRPCRPTSVTVKAVIPSIPAPSLSATPVMTRILWNAPLRNACLGSPFKNACPPDTNLSTTGPNSSVVFMCCCFIDKVDSYFIIGRTHRTYHLSVERLQNVLAVPLPQAVEHLVVAISATSKGAGHVESGHSRAPGNRPRSKQRAGHDDGPFEKSCVPDKVHGRMSGALIASCLIRCWVPLDASETM